MTRHPPSLDDLIVGPEILAGYLDLIPNTIARLATQSGMPRVGRGKYPLGLCIAWYLKRLESRALDHPSALKDERRKLITAQCEAQELSNVRTRGELLGADLVAATMREILSRLSARLDAIPLLASELSRLRDPGAIAAVVFDRCREVRRLAALDMTAFAQSLDDGPDA